MAIVMGSPACRQLGRYGQRLQYLGGRCSRRHDSVTVRSPLACWRGTGDTGRSWKGWPGKV
jgi:hypothetical protein